MITLDWKDRLVQDSIDYFERKLPGGDYDFDIIYNAYPGRTDNKIPRDVIVLVANTLATKMFKNHNSYLPFCDYIWKHKGINGKIAFSCIISKFLRKDQQFYLDYTKKYLYKTNDLTEINMLLDKIFYPLFKKQPLNYIEIIINWMRDDHEKINQQLIKTVFKIAKNDADFLNKFINRLEHRWMGASPEFVKICGFFLKQLSKHDYGTYLGIYKNYKTSREPIFVEILTYGLVKYDDMVFEMYENWSKSGNARLKKSAVSGLKFLNKRK